jgi:hypothetical protein
MPTKATGPIGGLQRSDLIRFLSAEENVSRLEICSAARHTLRCKSAWILKLIAKATRRRMTLAERSTAGQDDVAPPR